MVSPHNVHRKFTNKTIDILKIIVYNIFKEESWKPAKGGFKMRKYYVYITYNNIKEYCTTIEAYTKIGARRKAIKALRCTFIGNIKINSAYITK